jgi:hypothetical protein
MNAKTRLFALAALLVAGGCVPTVNPVHTENDLMFDEAFVGVWVQESSGAKWAATKRDEKSYRLVYTDKEGGQSRFVGRLAKLQGSLFLDLCPGDVDVDASPLTKFHLVPIHTIYLVRRTEPAPQLAAMNLKWLEEYLERDRVRLAQRAEGDYGSDERCARVRAAAQGSFHREH